VVCGPQPEMWLKMVQWVQPTKTSSTNFEMQKFSSAPQGGTPHLCYLKSACLIQPTIDGSTELVDIFASFEQNVCFGYKINSVDQIEKRIVQRRRKTF